MLNKAFGGISKGLSTLSAAVLFFCTVMYGINSLARFFLNSFMGWIEEGICYFICIMTWLFLQTLDYENRNLNIDFLYNKMENRPKIKKIFDIVQGIVNLFISCVLIYAGYFSIRQAIVLHTKNIATGWPYIYLYGPMYIGLVLFALFWVYRLLKSVIQRGGKNG